MIYINVLDILGKITSSKSQSEVINWLRQENGAIQFLALPDSSGRNIDYNVSIVGYRKEIKAVGWDMANKKPIPQYSYEMVW